jgi:two-component system OmpR family response regulator
VVDDEPHIVDFISLGLRREGYEVRGASNGHQALAVAEAWQPHLVILDLMLPGIDGLQVCRTLHTRSSAPILLLTARDEVEDRVQGLDSGADDYLCKPFSFAELAARSRALLRRSGILAGTQTAGPTSASIPLRERSGATPPRSRSRRANTTCCCCSCGIHARC